MRDRCELKFRSWSTDAERAGTISCCPDGGDLDGLARVQEQDPNRDGNGLDATFLHLCRERGRRWHARTGTCA
jgi:hypothetical protein